MSWFIRTRGERTAHYLDCYSQMGQSYVCEQTPCSQISTLPSMGVSDETRGKANEPNLWLLEIKSYRGLYRAIHRERAEDPRRTKHRASLVVYPAHGNCDNEIRNLLHIQQLTLKPIHYYSRYEEFLEDLLIMLDDVLAAHELDRYSVADRLAKAGFDAVECGCLTVFEDYMKRAELLE